MSKYFLFAYERYEQSGGFYDHVKTANTIAELEDTLKRYLQEGTSFDRAHIATIDAEGDLIYVSDYSLSDYPLTIDGAIKNTHNPHLVAYRWLKSMDDHKYAEL